MIRSTVRMAMVPFICALIAACSGQDSHDEKQKEVMKGFEGGCATGMVLYVQNQFEPYGAKARDDVLAGVDSPGPTVKANKRLVATGWYDTGKQLYPDNPSGIRGEVWYYVPRLKIWVTDAAVRSRPTSHAPGNASRFFTKKLRPKQSSDCRLKRIG